MLIKSDFEPAWWLKNRHLQTLFRNGPWGKMRNVSYRREEVELPDGDFLHVDWATGQGLPEKQPIVIVLHGLEGSIRSAYASAIMAAVRNAGWQGALMHFRGCSGAVNRLARTYHAGETEDLRFFLQRVSANNPGVPIAATGYSIGGNVLLKFLAEDNPVNTLTTAVAISVPFELRIAADTIATGFSQLYQWSLLRRMRDTIRKKFTPDTDFVDYERALASRTFHEFDEFATAPLHGFASCKEYYDRCSSRQYLKQIEVPTLILHATDDPFLDSSGVPHADELSDAVTLELSNHGGHVGFISGPLFRPEYWLDTRIMSHLRKFLEKK